MHPFRIFGVLPNLVLIYVVFCSMLGGVKAWDYCGAGCWYFARFVDWLWNWSHFLAMGSLALFADGLVLNFIEKII